MARCGRTWQWIAGRGRTWQCTANGRHRPIASPWVKLKEADSQLATVRNGKRATYGANDVIFQIKLTVPGARDPRVIDLPVNVKLKKEALKQLGLDAAEPPEIVLWAVSVGGHRRPYMVCRPNTFHDLWQKLPRVF